MVALAVAEATVLDAAPCVVLEDGLVGSPDAVSLELLDVVPLGLKPFLLFRFAEGQAVTAVSTPTVVAVHSVVGVLVGLSVTSVHHQEIVLG